ncbi:MAG: DegV family protein [Christensenellaceae bacterium]|jgi:DegV family protein with EDD domain|nr:DegV family protein [Christensenellaceae bacterium]
MAKTKEIKNDKKIVLFSDTDSDLRLSDIKEFDIHILNMPVYIDGEEYIINYEKEPRFDAFYKAVREHKKVSTAAINVQDYKDTFSPFLKNGQDILYVAFSSGLSATFESLKIALKELKEEFPDRTVHYVDTLNISLGAGILAREAGVMLKNGKTPEEIVKFIEETKHKIQTIFVVDDLGYLKRGGRISAATAFVGGILNFKPVLMVDAEGKLTKKDKCQGTKRSIEYLVNFFKENWNENSEMPIYIIENSDTIDSKIFLEKISAAVPAEKQHLVVSSWIGPVVGAHSGPGTRGIVFEGR